MKALNKDFLALLSFWCWIGTVLLSFLAAVISITVTPLPKIPVAVLSVLVFAMALSVVIINPGIFAKRFGY